MQAARALHSFGTFWIAALPVLVFLLSPPATSGKTLLVVAPHPDDEALLGSGIIYSALARGDTVRVVVMTNGDTEDLCPVPRSASLVKARPLPAWPVSD